jgi:hypothetical protein
MGIGSGRGISGTRGFIGTTGVSGSIGITSVEMPVISGSYNYYLGQTFTNNPVFSPEPHVWGKLAGEHNVACPYCRQYGEAYTQCAHCGAPIDPEG